MLSAALIVLLLAILAAAFGTMVVGPAGPVVALVLLFVAGILFIKVRSGAGEPPPGKR